MTDPKRPESPVPPSGEDKAKDHPRANAGNDPASGAATDASAEETSAEANKLSAEEQMARFEEELKENDWGHQPC